MKHLTLKDITDDLVVIKINQSYYEGISAEALYDYTRGIWWCRIDSVSPAKFALSVYYGIVIEVYKIDYWMPTTKAVFKTRTVDPVKAAKRIAFAGKVADESIRRKYIGKSVENLYEWGDAHPVKLFRKYKG